MKKIILLTFAIAFLSSSAFAYCDSVKSTIPKDMPNNISIDSINCSEQPTSDDTCNTELRRISTKLTDTNSYIIINETPCVATKTLVNKKLVFSSNGSIVFLKSR